MSLLYWDSQYLKALHSLLLLLGITDEVLKPLPTELTAQKENKGIKTQNAQKKKERKSITFSLKEYAFSMLKQLTSRCQI